jgi:hypothetical protein
MPVPALMSWTSPAGIVPSDPKAACAGWPSVLTTKWCFALSQPSSALSNDSLSNDSLSNDSLADASRVSAPTRCMCHGGMQAGTGTHLSAVECRGLTEIRNNAPVTHERNMSELAALEQAGYHPGWFFDLHTTQPILRPRSIRSISGTRLSAR